MDKIPDVVKSLKEFSGQPGEFNSWKKSVDRILTIYEPIKGTPKYYGILSVIRNKITGNADIALESYNTPLNWSAISQCLITHYGDKRDLSTLEYQMTTLVQGNNSIQEFYQKVYSHLSLILNRLGCLEMGIREPMDLPQALHLCLKLENQNFRSNHAYNGRWKPPSQQYSKRNSGQQQNPIFHPQLAYIPQPRQLFFNQREQNNAIPPRPPRPQPKPEPMEVDSSMHSHRINYMNRPQPNQHFGKRPQQFGNHQQAKNQRTYHINTTGITNEQQLDEDKQFGEPSDIHFLA